MATITREDVRNQVTEAQYEVFKHWPVDWSAVVVGALAAVALVLIVGLVGLAVGMHMMDTNNRLADLETVEFGALALSVLGAFVAFIVGGWVAGKVAGILYAEHAMLHGAIVWLLAVPMLIILGALGS